jgi:acyl-CoA dehydrogenase
MRLLGAIIQATSEPLGNLMRATERFMDPFLTDAQSTLKAELHDFVERTIRPLPEGEGDEHSKEMARMLAAQGLLRYIAPRRHGGIHEQPQLRDLCIIREELARGSALADVVFAMQGLGAYPIILAGAEEQKRRFLPPILRGEHLAAFAVTEPDAGSDVAAIATRALRDGDSYVLDGTKRFISNAGIAQTYCLFARTDPNAGSKGITAFVIEAGTAGLDIKRTRLISPHPIGELELRGCRILLENRLGDEGDGMRIALGTLDLFRVTVGAAAVGMAQRALEEATGYAVRRKQFGKPLAEFQAIQMKIADMATELEAARVLVYRAAWKRDVTGDAATAEASMAKLFATEAAQRIIDQALQIHGGAGLVYGSTMERLYRDVRATRIYEGASDIQRLIVARHLLKKAR